MQSIHTEHYKRLIASLVEARQTSGLTQQQLADRWGRKQSIVAKIETCERRIDVVEYLILCEIVGFDPIDVIEKARREIRIDQEKTG